MTTALVRGLARNPAAPADLLLRLLQTAPETTCQGLAKRRELPRAVQEAMFEHPLRAVRRALARHPRVGVDLRARLLADPDWWVAIEAFGTREQPPLADDVLSALLGRIEDSPPDFMTIAEVYGELMELPRYNPRLYPLAAAHPDPRVRRHAAGVPAWLDEASLEALLADPVAEIRAATAAAVAEDRRLMQPADLPEHHCHRYWYVLQRPLSRELAEQVVASGDRSALSFVAGNPTTPPEVVRDLLRDPDLGVRGTLAQRDDLTHEQLLALAADPDVEVRTAVSANPGLTDAERAGIDIAVDRFSGEGRATRRVPPLDDAVRWARSVNPLLRRRAARNPELPAELVAALGEDPDPGVRLRIAQHHPDAPPELLLRCFLEYDGHDREELTERPHFPTAGLAAFAGHADPAVRRLVARDPQADPEVIEQLSADPDGGVRQVMAACPRLPVARLLALLDDPELAEAAAANPALPMERVRQILAAAGASLAGAAVDALAEQVGVAAVAGVLLDHVDEDVADGR